MMLHSYMQQNWTKTSFKNICLIMSTKHTAFYYLDWKGYLQAKLCFNAAILFKKALIKYEDLYNLVSCQSPNHENLSQHRSFIFNEWCNKTISHREPLQLPHCDVMEHYSQPDLANCRNLIASVNYWMRFLPDLRGSEWMKVAWQKKKNENKTISLPLRNN